MDTCSSSGKSVCLDLNSFTLGGSSIGDRSGTLHESSIIHDAKKSTHLGTSTLVEDCIHSREKIVADALVVHENDKIESSATVVQKCLSNSRSFPPSGKISSWSTSSVEKSGSAYLENGCKECSNATYSRSISLPNPLKLVSAVKGSREKQGMDPKKLTVTWAPDVYDPPPTSTSHVKQNGQQCSKNRKNKHKGKAASRGSSSSKDKKHIRKTSGNSDICYKTRYRLACRTLTDHDKLADFAVEGCNLNCGSSFLKKSLGNAPLPVAEAAI